MTQGTNVVNSWKHFERIFVEETLMEYLWRGFMELVTPNLLTHWKETWKHKISILVPLPQLPRTLSSLPSLLTEIEQISLTPTAPVIGAIYVETNPGFLFFHCVHLSAFGRVCRPNKAPHLSMAQAGKPSHHFIVIVINWSSQRSKKECDLTVNLSLLNCLF